MDSIEVSSHGSATPRSPPLATIESGSEATEESVPSAAKDTHLMVSGSGTSKPDGEANWLPRYRVEIAFGRMQWG